MKITSAVLALLAPCAYVAADESPSYEIPLPGLEDRPYFRGLKREDFALHTLHEYDHNQKIDYNGDETLEQEVLENTFKDLHDKFFHHQFPGKVPTNETRTHPTVMSSEYCSTAVDRLKAGPANIPEVICQGQKWTDTTFSGQNMVYWEGLNPQNAIDTYKGYFRDNLLFFKDWSTVYPNADIFNPDGTIHYSESIQGSAGTCYIISALGSLGRYPDLVRNTFVTPTKNSAGIIGVKFWIRGKPWVVDVDESMIWMYYNNPTLFYTKVSADKKAMWAAILEKAWAKVKGNYMTSEYGFFENGIYALTGTPVIRYQTADITSYGDAEKAWAKIRAADAADYLMGAATGAGSDQNFNDYGIALGHAYSLLTAFELVEGSTVHKVVMFRNPWGTAHYHGPWSKDDSRWTSQLVAQVPYGIDVRTAQQAEGVFIVPIDLLIGSRNCFDNYQIAHQRASEGYTQTWYDQEGDDGQQKAYTFTVDSSASSDVYFQVSTYAQNIIPPSCTTGVFQGQTINLPIIFYAVYAGATEIAGAAYVDQFPRPSVVGASSHSQGTTYAIYVQVYYFGSPHPDHTVKVYSKYNSQILENGRSNQLNMDGQQPSGFTDSDYRGMDHNSCGLRFVQ